MCSPTLALDDSAVSDSAAAIAAGDLAAAREEAGVLGGRADAIVAAPAARVAATRAWSADNRDDADDGVPAAAEVEVVTNEIAGTGAAPAATAGAGPALGSAVVAGRLNAEVRDVDSFLSRSSSKKGWEFVPVVVVGEYVRARVFVWS